MSGDALPISTQKVLPSFLRLPRPFLKKKGLLCLVWCPTCLLSSCHGVSMKQWWWKSPSFWLIRQCTMCDRAFCHCSRRVREQFKLAPRSGDQL